MYSASACEVINYFLRSERFKCEKICKEGDAYLFASESYFLLSTVISAINH